MLAAEVDARSVSVLVSSQLADISAAFARTSRSRIPFCSGSALQLAIILVLVSSLVIHEQHLDGLVSFAVSGAGALMIVGITCCSAIFVTHRTCSTATTADRARALDIRLTLHYALWGGGVALLLFGFDWAQTCQRLTSCASISRVLLLLPSIASLIVGWSILYAAERELTPDLCQLGRWGFVVLKTRMYLALPITLLLTLLACQDLLAASLFATNRWLAAALLVFVVTLLPVACRLMCNARSLPPGELRARLEQSCRQQSIQPRDILVWDTGKRLRNAAIFGLFPGRPYVLLSDSLMQDLPIDQVEAVFLHEIGHVRYSHQGKLTATCVFFSCSSVYLLSQAAHAGHTMAGLLGIAGGLIVVGSLSRTFELQADLWAAQRTVKGPKNYLAALAAIQNGCFHWSHPSFDQRFQLLHQNEQRAQRCIARQLGISGGLALSLAAGLALSMWVL